MLDQLYTGMPPGQHKDNTVHGAPQESVPQGLQGSPQAKPLNPQAQSSTTHTEVGEECIWPKGCWSNLV